VPIRFTDAEISDLLTEPKQLPTDYRSKLQPKASKRGQLERELTVLGDNGTEFTIIVRQSIANPLRFSVILACPAPGLTTRFLLRRYNGDHGPHTNRLENTVVRGTHIHIATERYQAAGYDEEAFAVADTRFVDIHSAIDSVIADCSFVTVLPELTLFGGH
jgi:hypothetical protein